MNINFLSQSTGLSTVQKTKFKNSTAPNYRLNAGKDVFVKSTNNISFGSADKAKYAEIKRDVTDYFLNAKTLDVNEIEKIVKKYSPSTNFADIKKIPRNANVHTSTVAYTHEPSQFLLNESGKIAVETLPKTIYFNFNTPAKNQRDERIILIDRLVHEMTHILQDEEGSDTRKLDYFNAFLSTQTNNDRAIRNIQAINLIYNTVEKAMIGALADSLPPTTTSLPQKINEKTDIDTLFVKKIKTSPSTLMRNALSRTLNVANMQFGGIDRNFALDFVILKAKNEKEAYQNALDSNKELLGLNCKTDFDLRIEMYQKMIDVAQSMKK